MADQAIPDQAIPDQTLPDLRDLVDAALESTVALSFTSIGHDVRRRLYGWSDDLEDLSGRRMVITGANSGLGLATATALAARGADVVLAVRDAERGEQARASIAAATANDGVTTVELDLADLTSVRSAAVDLRQGPPIDTLVHNAGALLERRIMTADDLETTFSVHVAGPSLLTAELVDHLAPNARVIWVSSGGMYAQSLDLDDLSSARDYSGTRAYSRAKRMQVVLSRCWAERLAPRGIVVHAMHPGWADTPGVVNALPMFHQLVGPLLRTSAQGADTIVWLASAVEPGETSGGFWLDRRPRSTDRVPWTKVSADERAQLWDAVADAVGMSSSP